MNKEDNKLYQREYRKKNPEKIKRHIMKYRETHEEGYKNYMRNYYAKNKGKISRKMKLKRKVSRVTRKYQKDMKRSNLAYKFLRAEARLTKGIGHDYKVWMMENSRLFTKVNSTESNKVSNSCDGRIKQCYYNCWKSFSINRGYRYFEGYVISKSVPIPLEHAWLVNKKNEVIDPTLIIDVDEKLKLMDRLLGDRIGSTDRLGDEYLGVEIPVDVAKKMGFKIKKSGPYIFDYFKEVTS